MKLLSSIERYYMQWGVLDAFYRRMGMATQYDWVYNCWIITYEGGMK